MTFALSLFLFWLSLWLLTKVQPQASLKTKYILLLILAPFVLYPFVYSPVWWLRGLTGDLSILSLFLLASALYQQLYGSFWIEKNERKLLEKSVVVLGLFFYPLALGLSTYDPYALGYADPYFVAAIVTLAGLAVFTGYKVIAAMMILMLISWNLQLLQSVNLWDYILDPFIWFFYMGRIVRGLVHR